MAKPKQPHGRLDLSAVHPKFRRLARAIYKDAPRFAGRLVWLVPTDAEGKPELAAPFQLPDVQTSSMDAILTVWRDDRGKQPVYAFGYTSVRSAATAARAHSPEAGFARLLQACGANGIQLAGFALDVASGGEAERPALAQLQAAARDGAVKVVVTPMLNRIDRDLETFTARMARWARWGVIVYYGRRYGDTRLDYVFWPDFESRERGVRIIHLAEQYVAQLRQAISRAKAYKRIKSGGKEVARDG